MNGTKKKKPTTDQGRERILSGVRSDSPFSMVSFPQDINLIGGKLSNAVT